jgi:predicted metalloprotease with PDZ domain
MPHEVRVALPHGWRAASALEEDGSGWWAASYEELVDAPIECSKFADAIARAAGRSYRIVVDGVSTVPARFVEDVARIAEAEVHIAGTPPYRRYVMFVHLSDEAGRIAALEHAASTSIIVPKKSFSDADAYDELTYVVAHELFHAWNAKLLRPTELVPYDFMKPQRARSLWITEGLTEYFAHRAMLRSGRWNRAAYLQHVGDEAARAAEAAARSISVEDAAEMTWQPPDDAADDWDAYYARGHLIALALDATMRVRSDGKHGLDELVHNAVAAAERSSNITRLGTRILAEAVDGLLPALGIGAAMEKWVAGPNESKDVRVALATIGLALECMTKELVAAGFSAEREGSGLRVVAVGDGGPADLAGLKPGDRIVTIDGAPPAARWPERIARGAVGDKLALGVTRAQQRLELHVTLESEPDTTCKLTQAPATPAVTKLRDALLSP